MKKIYIFLGLVLAFAFGYLLNAYAYNISTIKSFDFYFNQNAVLSKEIKCTSELSSSLDEFDFRSNEPKLNAEIEKAIIQDQLLINSSNENYEIEYMGSTFSATVEQETENNLSLTFSIENDLENTKHQITVNKVTGAAIHSSVGTVYNEENFVSGYQKLMSCNDL